MGAIPMHAATDGRRGDALDRTLARADLYRLLSVGFRDPDGPQGGVLEPDALASAAEDLAIGLSEPERRALRRAGDLSVRAQEHRWIFGHTVAHGCPPYETEYERDHLFAQAQQLGDIAGFYRAFGLVPSDAGGERLDHVACELEFLGVVALKEACALARSDAALAEICRTSTGAFLRDHIGRWMPALGALIVQRASGSGYAALATLATRALAAHAAEISVTPDALGASDLRPVSGEAEGFAFACGVDDADVEIPR